MASMHAASAPVRALRTPAGDPAWLVSGYDEVRALIADSRLSWTTSAAGASRYPQAAMMGHPDAPGQNSGAGRSFAKVPARSFAPRRIQQLRPRVQQHGLGDLIAGLVSQGLRIFDSVRQNLGNDAPGTAPAMREDGDR